MRRLEAESLRRDEPGSSRFHASSRTLLKLALHVGLALSLSCSDSDPGRPSGNDGVPAGARSSLAAERSSVLLITVDTLRADRLGAYGYAYDVSPRIDALAQSGVRFSDATVQWPKTWPSMASLLTGTYPATTGIGAQLKKLSPSLVLLSEIFRDAGYDVGAVVANFNIGRTMGFDQGFGHFVESWEEKWREEAGAAHFQNAPGKVKRYTNATLVTDQALRWLWDREGDERPFFLWIHYMDPHGPYLPPARYAEQFAHERATTVIPLRLLPRYQRQMRAGRVITDLAFYQAQYDREIRYLDDELGRFFDAIAQLSIGSPLVVLTSDHGESMGEHDYYLEHGALSYQPTARVPLVIAQPGRIEAGLTIEAPVGLIDVSATMLELAGLPVPDHFEGVSLAGRILGHEAAVLPEYVFMQAGSKSAKSQLAVREGRWKLIHIRWRPDRKLMTGDEFELYDLASDPGETTNVVGEHPEVAKRLRAALERWYAERPPRFGKEPAIDPASLHPADREMLKALGYLE